MRFSTTTLAISALLSTAYAGDGLFRFCNDWSIGADNTPSCPSDNLSTSATSTIDPKTKTFICIDAPSVTWEQCVVIPDFNAKGDKGSCGQALMDTGSVALGGCIFYEDDARKSSHTLQQSGRWFLDPAAARNPLPATTIFRSVKCSKTRVQDK